MDADTQSLIDRLHAAPTMAVMAVAGAGAKAISWLLSTPGASRTVLEAIVPYSPTSLVELLRYPPDQFVSTQIARDMARSAYQRAVRLREQDVPVVGIGCTATIATDRAKRGPHRCHVAAWSQQGVTVHSLELVKGLRDRRGEEWVVSMLVLRALAEASGVEFTVPMGLVDAERVESHTTRYEHPFNALLAEHVDTVTVFPDGSAAADRSVQGALLPGSFNPLHQGHERLAQVASQMLTAPVTFELSVVNVDKPPLTEAQIRERVAQFAGKWPVVVTRGLVFYQKARLFPKCTFVIGWDTAVRLVDPRYYGGDEFEMRSALAEINDLGCRFLVAGRVDGGVFHTLNEVVVPKRFAGMFTPIPEYNFRCDLSSTELRLASGRR